MTVYQGNPPLYISYPLGLVVVLHGDLLNNRAPSCGCKPSMSTPVGFNFVPFGASCCIVIIEFSVPEPSPCRPRHLLRMELHNYLPM